MRLYTSRRIFSGSEGKYFRYRLTATRAFGSYFFIQSSIFLKLPS